MDFEAMLRLMAARVGTKDEILGSLEQTRRCRGDARFAGAVKLEFEGVNVAQHDVHIRAQWWTSS
ncbi:MAG: hypothetical protein R2716_09755 [Microthrixaceae bacterium]